MNRIEPPYLAWPKVPGPPVVDVDGGLLDVLEVGPYHGNVDPATRDTLRDLGLTCVP